MNILVVYPHWPPSNLVGAQRVRLLANGLVRIGHNVEVVTVDPKYYEEPLSWELCDLVDRDVRVTHTKAFHVGSLRLIGDIGLRGFWFLYRECLRLIDHKKIDFLWVSLPSYYTGLLGRLIEYRTGMPYAIDYIDPWVRDNDQRKSWRFRLTNYLSKFLEPIAIRRASVISGVSRDYFAPVLNRNFRVADLANGLWKGMGNDHNIHELAFPYGYDQCDYDRSMQEGSGSNEEKIWLYAGAFMPHATGVVSAFFNAIAHLRTTQDWDESIKIRFVGTGYYQGESITNMADGFGLGQIVEEFRERLPYNDILKALANSESILLFGSTEAHYTPSKVFQSLLSTRPIVGALHKKSDGLTLLKSCNSAGYIVEFDDVNHLTDEFIKVIIERIVDGSWNPDMLPIKGYTVENIAKKVEAVLQRSLSANKKDTILE